MCALGEQDFSTWPILILHVQVVKLKIQAVKNVQSLNGNTNCLLLTNTLKLAYFRG